MELVCKPCGRGNWAPIKIRLDSERMLPMLFSVGQKLLMGGLMLRIHRINL